MPIRFIDVDFASYLRSQTTYHGIAHSFDENTPNTIIMLRPNQPYICIGFNQDIHKVIDLDYCKQKNIPIVRREIGGGAVYLDENQVFVQWIFRSGSLPMRLKERFKFHAFPLAATYKSLGIDADYHPINDIQVDGKKLAGLGAGTIGSAEVLVGNFILDFDYEVMARILKTPNHKLRDKVYQSLTKYLTSIKKEIGDISSFRDIKTKYLHHCKRILAEPIEEGELTSAEVKKIEKLDQKFSSDQWLYDQGSLVHSAVKIHNDVWIGETTFQTEGGEINTIIRSKKDRIDDISLSGNFSFSPQSKLEKFEKALLQTKINKSSVLDKVTRFYKTEKVDSPGIEPNDWVSAITSFTGSIYSN